MNKCIFFALITSKRPDHGRSDLLRLILSFTSLLKFKIARDISYIHTVESTQILFVAKEMLFCGEMAILRTLCRTCGARARVRINVQMDCHSTDVCITESHAPVSEDLVAYRHEEIKGFAHTLCGLLDTDRAGPNIQLARETCCK